MDKGKGIAVERVKEEANSSLAISKKAQSSSVLLLDYTKSHYRSSAIMSKEKLVELLDSLLMNLHVLSSILKSIFPLMPQYETLQNVCGNIKDFHGLKVNGCVDPEIIEYVIPRFRLMAERVGDFCQVIIVDQLDVPQVYVKLTHLRVKIIPLGLEVIHIYFTKLNPSKSPELGCFFMQLLEVSPDILKENLINLEEYMVNVTTTGTSARKIHVMIEFLLIILTDMPKDFIHHVKLFGLLARVRAVTKEVFILVRDSEEKSRNEETTNETYCATRNFLKKIELLKQDLKYAFLKAPEPSELYFDASDGPLFINLLLRDLNDLLRSNAYSVNLIKEEIGIVKEDLEFIRSFFGCVEQELNKDLWKRSLDVAYEAKYAINSILARNNGLLHLSFSLPSAIEKIKLIKREVSNLPEKVPRNRCPNVANFSNKSVENRSLTDGQIFVGFKEETDRIIMNLTNGPAELDVISIVGMAGLGKTTLAYKVYNDKSVISHFDIRAWCTIDQEYDRKMVFQKILNQVTGSEEHFGEDIDVDDVLRRKLFGRRYLIVLDDVWDTATWDDLTRPFPQVQKGSRIMLTSRKNDVALHGKRHSDPLHLRLLRREESWELLEKRVFREENCPVELLDVGIEIALNCQGLPLVVDLIAGVIARRGKEKKVWLEIQNHLNSFIFKNEDGVMKVIQLSYDQLSDYLKLCFLYLGSYRKDEKIEVNQLKNLWSAEGFVEVTGTKSAEEAMEDYLDHLVSSSLVTVSRGVYGEKVCQIHDLVHDFCLIKARKEKLFDMISSIAPSSSSDLMPRQWTIHYEEHLPQSYKNTMSTSSCKHLLSFKIAGEMKGHRISHLRYLRLLRVLNLDSYFITMPYYLLNEIGVLVHLRYLNIGTACLKALPLSFSKLWNLETLLVYNEGVTMALEPVIWNLAKLRHVEIMTCSLSDLGTDEPTFLEKLRIIERLELSCSKGQEDILKMFPNLQKLDCRIGTSRDSSAAVNWFPQFSFLKELEELRVYNLHSLDPCDSPLPSSLRSLTLEHGFLTSDSLSTIARLPNLQELHLKHLDIQGKEWNIQNDNSFENVKFLEVYRVSFSKWQVGEESFPVLEHVILRYCEELKEIPPSFGDTDSLRSIKLIGNPQLKDSALEIKKYVENMTGEDKLQVIVY